jgi:hypothetical protein
MCPFSVTVQHVPDRELGPLLTRLAEAGFNNPTITHVDADGESYRWPDGRDRYKPYRVFIGTTRAEGAVQIGLGDTVRKNKWGRDRKYVVAFLSAGSPQQPLVEFVAADDYEQTRELVAVVRGSDGGRRMYGVGDPLPAAYTDRFRTQLYNERVVYPGAWNKVVVVAREDDDEAILNHALIQSRRRYRT